MTNLNEREMQMLMLALESLRHEMNMEVEKLKKRLAEADLKADGTPKKRPGRPPGRKNSKKPAMKKVAPVLKEAA